MAIRLIKLTFRKGNGTLFWPHLYDLQDTLISHLCAGHEGDGAARLGYLVFHAAALNFALRI